MKKWVSWITASGLALSLMGCAPAANQNGNATVQNTGNGTNPQNHIYNTNSTTNTPKRNFNANANLNDQAGYPGSYADNSMYKPGTTRSHYSYVTYTKTDMNKQQSGSFYVDRDVLARAVGTVVTSIPGVDESSVLVTDEDLFVGVKNVKNARTLNKVKLSAWGMAPRYYKVYVTSDGNTIAKVKTFIANSNNRNQLNEAKLEKILKANSVDMTGTNVTDNGQNTTNYNLNTLYPNTNSTHQKMK